MSELEFEYIVSFGDSISDHGNDGNFFNALGLPFPFQPEEFYPDGRFSNGPMWIESFAEGLGLAIPTLSTELSILDPANPIPSPIAFDSEGNPFVSPYFNGNTVETSINFAFGGTSLTTGNGEADGEQGPFPLIKETVNWFIEDHQQVGETIDDDTLITFFNVGVSDYSGAILFQTGNPLDLIDDVVGTTITLFEDLYANGARHFLWSDLPDYSRLPLSLVFPPEAIQLLSAVTLEHNAALSKAMATLQDRFDDITIIKVELYELVEDMATNPQEFGLSEVVFPYLPTQIGNPDEFLWLDDRGHPTTAVHSILADEALDAVDSVISGTSDDDHLKGKKNDELLLGRDGEDRLYGSKGDDSLYGGDDEDRLYGGKGDDYLYGGDDEDRLYGGKGDDYLYGGDDEDRLYGDKGDDILDGGKDSDVLFGGKGADQFVLRAGDGIDRILDYVDGIDKFLLDGLEFDNLTISQGFGKALISVTATEEILAKVIGINLTVSSIGEEDFLSL
jgi:phospholipase/lecithinase/hemolysin